jgi:peptidylprolyl isomerase
MTTVNNASTVTLHYKGTLESGEVFDSSYDREEPMTVELGQGTLIPLFEEQLLGMGEGDSQTFTLNPEDAYGDTNPDAFITLEKTQFPDEFDFSTGSVVPLEGPGGQKAVGKIASDDESTVTIDMNHPLAGETLTFEVSVLAVDGGKDALSDTD